MADSHDLERALDAARRAATSAGQRIAGYARDAAPTETWDKAEDSPVTQADLDADRIITRILRESHPDDPILSEETADDPARTAAERIWIVDPLDGTKEFIQQIPEYAVSVALVLRGEPVVGVVYQPLTRECFYGARGLGAWLDGARIRVSAAQRLEDATMLSSRTEMGRGQVDRFKDWFLDVRPVGSVALKLAHTAAGRGDVWLSTAPKSEWDVCGGDLLIREAGGIFETMDAGPRIYNQEDVLLRPLMAAGPPALVRAVFDRARGTA